LALYNLTMSITLTKEVNEKLIAEAKRSGMSPEALAEALIQESLKGQPFHDLDYLAGTWSEEEAKDFEKNTAAFEAVDEKLWHDSH
jgi:hypothetical protein